MDPLPLKKKNPSQGELRGEGWPIVPAGRGGTRTGFGGFPVPSNGLPVGHGARHGGRVRGLHEVQPSLGAVQLLVVQGP